MQASQALYQRINQEGRSLGDVRLAELHIRLGFLIANAQEYTLPWYQRTKAIIQTYDTIENHVLRRHAGNDRFQRAYAQLLAKRGRQHRVLGLFDICETGCASGLALTDQSNDYSLRTHFLCEQAHIEATSGNDIVWMSKLEIARQDVSDFPWTERFLSFRQINYMQGEGYKRFAFHTRKEFPLDLREKYAKLALEHFISGDGMTIEVPGFEALVATISRIQCLVFLDPEQAIHLAEEQKVLTEKNYPTLLAKIQRILFLAQNRLQTDNRQFLQIFQESTYVAYQTGANIL